MNQAKKSMAGVLGLLWPLPLLLVGLYLTRLNSYLLFHSLSELFSVVVAAGVFAVAWNTRDLASNAFLLFVGEGFLCMAFFDLLHTISYQGMGVMQHQGANLPTQLWVAARYLQAATLALAPFFLGRRLPPYASLAGFFTLTALLLSSIFWWNLFPDCLVPPEGLTAFKKNSEYFICLLFTLAGAGLWAKRQFLDQQVLFLILLSLAVSVTSELAFTLYTGVTDTFNLIGHLLKLVAFFLIFVAFVRTGLNQPINLLFRDLAQSNAALQAQAQELRRSNRELDSFASVASHDLSAPLVTVRGYALLLEQRNSAQLDRDGRQYLQALLGSVERMSGLLQELLAYARLGSSGLEMKPVAADEVLGKVLDDLSADLTGSGARVETRPLPRVNADSSQLYQLFTNLVANAMKFHGPQPPLVRISGSQTDGLVTICVQDNGIGIDPKYHQEVFSVFKRLHASDEFPGNGMGLAICQRIVERHGGRIWLDSQPDAGARFCFSLPAATGG